MSSTRQPPMGTPQLSTHAGLTPQMLIVDANGRPTMFFFRWLLTIGGAALTSDDLSILESFDPGADTALAESAIADALAAARLAAGFDDGGAARADLIGRLEHALLAGALRGEGWPPGPDADQRALEALMIADAPPTPPTPITFLADTLANWTLANYNPANYANGQQFVVTTWQVTYAIEAGVWTYIAGVYIAPAASRPATAFNGAALGALDIGLEFLASDTLLLYYWSGSAWVLIPVNTVGAGTYGDATHSPAITVDANGRVTAIANTPITASGAPSGPAGGDLGGTYPNPTVKTVTPFTPNVLIGGSAAGVALTSTATSTRIGNGTGSTVTVECVINITAWPASPVGTVTITGFPSNPPQSCPGVFSANSGFTGLTPGGSIITVLGTSGILTLYTQIATGRTALLPTTIGVSSNFQVTLTYPSA